MESELVAIDFVTSLLSAKLQGETDMEMEDFLRKVYKEELAKTLERHSQQTPLCPSIAKFLQFAEQGWPEELKKHARSCQYCQKSLAVAWNVRNQHPTEDELKQENNVNRVAVEYHIDHYMCELCCKIRTQA